MSAHDTIVRRLRVRGHTGDALRLRLRATAVIAGADLHAPSLDRASILCIRKMSDPRPRSLALTEHRARPHAEWELAARRNISALADRAVRPALGAVPASAEAVLFLDRAELLACLAAAWTDGHVGSCWWWRALFGVMDVAGIVRAWRDTPEHVPAACHLLANRRQLDRFVQRLPAADVVALTRDLARTFGVDAVDRVALTLSVALHHAPDPVAATPPIESDTRGAVARSHDRAQWARHFPELSPAAFAPERRLLIFTASVLHRSPSTARRILSTQSIEAIVAIEPAEPASATRATLPNAAVTTHDHSPNDVAGQLPSAFANNARGELAIDVGVNHDPVRKAVSAPAEGEATDAALAVVSLREPVTRPVTDVIETQFGGAFHLVNVGIALGLYSDFTAPAAPGIDLSIWDFIVLVTARLLDDERFNDDPIVPFLARLAGRDSSDSPGAGFTPDDAETLDAWLDALVPRIRDRVAAALAVPSDAAAALMVNRPARLTLTPSHLDIAFALDDLPVAIRLAGLDRDPGFVPAAGLTITFSYV